MLFLLSICFVPLFFFVSLYAQIALGESAADAGLFILVFFVGFTSARGAAGACSTAGRAPGGRARLRDRRRRLLPVGLELDDLSFNEQW